MSNKWAPKISAEQREEIRQLYLTGKYTFAQLGKMYGVTDWSAGKYCRDLKEKDHLETITTPEGKFRICKQCNNLRPLEHFEPNKRCLDQRGGRCIFCHQPQYRSPSARANDRIAHRVKYWKAKLAASGLPPETQEILLNDVKEGKLISI